MQAAEEHGSIDRREDTHCVPWGAGLNAPLSLGLVENALSSPQSPGPHHFYVFDYLFVYFLQRMAHTWQAVTVFTLLTRPGI